MQTVHSFSNLNEFDQSFRVLCIAPDTVSEGLRFNLDLEKNHEKKIELFSCLLKDANEELQKNSYDLVYYFCDFGQSLPLLSLEKMNVLGVVSFMNPTPKQLLDVFQLKGWSAFEWDGAQFQALKDKILDISQQARATSVQRETSERIDSWLDQKSTEIYALNISDKETLVADYIFSSEQVYISCGASQSDADIKLPVEGKEVLLSFKKQNNAWAVKSHHAQLNWKCHGKADRLCVGDEIEVGNFNLRFLESPFVSQLKKIQSKFSSQKKLSLSSQESTLFLALKKLMMSFSSGTMRLSNDLYTGFINLQDGCVIHAYTGPVRGEKALMRMLCWDSCSWEFRETQQTHVSMFPMCLEWAHFSRKYFKVQKEWSFIKAFKAPPELKLSVDPKYFLNQEKWEPKDFMVASAVAEYSCVRDILNFCPLLDHEIYSSLLKLRKIKLLCLSS